LVKNDGFDPKRPETHFLPWSTWFDPYWLGELGFGQKWQLWPETARNSFFTLVDMVWPVLTWWTRYIFELLFFWIFINNNRNKITFEKILVDPKLGYNRMFEQNFQPAPSVTWDFHFIPLAFNSILLPKKMQLRANLGSKDSNKAK